MIEMILLIYLIKSFINEKFLIGYTLIDDELIGIIIECNDDVINKQIMNKVYPGNLIEVKHVSN
jgi:hypothetical protein